MTVSQVHLENWVFLTTLPSGTLTFQVIGWSGKKVIFVRQCYIALYALCRRAWDAGTQGVFLKGIPGVGKSYFLDYVMNNLLNDGKTVLALSGPRKRAWLCSGFDRPAETSIQDTALIDRWSRKADFVFLDPHEDPQETLRLDDSIFCNKKFLISMPLDPMNCAKMVKDTEDVQSTAMEESASM